MDEISIRPWTEVETPTEVEIRGILDQEGLQPYRWSNAPGDVYAAHTHPFHKVIYVVQGYSSFHFSIYNPREMLKIILLFIPSALTLYNA